jgi:hypothetical protein
VVLSVFDDKILSTDDDDQLRKRHGMTRDARVRKIARPSSIPALTQSAEGYAGTTLRIRIKRAGNAASKSRQPLSER